MPNPLEKLAQMQDRVSRANEQLFFSPLGMAFFPDGKWQSKEPRKVVCIDVLRNCLKKLFKNEERLRLSVYEEPEFASLMSTWVFSHNTRGQLLATKRKLLTCRCDKKENTIFDLHTHKAPQSPQFYEAAFVEFSHFIWTLLSLYLRQYSPTKAEKVLNSPPGKFKDEGYAGLWKAVMAEQTDMYRTCFLWWEDVLDAAPVTFAAVALQYPDAGNAIREAIVEFPKLPPILMMLFEANDAQYLSADCPVMQRIVVKSQEDVLFLLTRTTSNPTNSQNWPKEYWRPHAADVLETIHDVMQRLSAKGEQGWQQSMWAPSMVEVAKAVYPLVPSGTPRAEQMYAFLSKFKVEPIVPSYIGLCKRFQTVRGYEICFNPDCPKADPEKPERVTTRSRCSGCKVVSYCSSPSIFTSSKLSCDDPQAHHHASALLGLIRQSLTVLPAKSCAGSRLSGLWMPVKFQNGPRRSG